MNHREEIIYVFKKSGIDGVMIKLIMEEMYSLPEEIGYDNIKDLISEVDWRYYETLDLPFSVLEYLYDDNNKDKIERCLDFCIDKQMQCYNYNRFGIPFK